MHLARANSKSDHGLALYEPRFPLEHFWAAASFKCSTKCHTGLCGVLFLTKKCSMERWVNKRSMSMCMYLFNV